MRKTFFLLCLLTLAMAMSLQNSFAQEQEPEQEELAPLFLIITTDGNEFIGTILYQDGETVGMKTEKFGEIRIPKRDIRVMRPLKGNQAQRGRFWLENPQATRYFWAPNGYGLRAGEGYYQNLWILWNQASYGISDNFSIGAGTVPLFLFNGTSSPVWLTPKISVPLVQDRLNVGGGALLGTVLGEDRMGFGIVYGVTTLGSRNQNITLGLGYGYAGGEWAQSPLINLSGMSRITKNGYLLTENYFINVGNTNLMMLSLGGRWMVVNKVGIDFGLFVPVIEEMNDFFVALPWLGFSVPFGKIH